MWHVWISSLGVTAAIILAGGYVWLQILKERHRFQLMRAAIERGITEFSESDNVVPSWFVSMRQGVAVLVLGIGLMVVGTAAWALANNVQPPAAGFASAPASTLAEEQAAPPPPPPAAEKGQPKHPPKAHHRPPPPPNPALERWHQAQQQQKMGLVVAGCGILIALLGVVRVVFAVIERRQFAASPGESQ